MTTHSNYVNHRGNHRYWTDDRLQELVDQHDAGKTYADIAASIGVSRCRAKDIVQRYRRVLRSRAAKERP